MGRMVCLLLLPLPVLPSQVLDRSKMTPCKFNPLCLCSNSGKELRDCWEAPVCNTHHTYSYWKFLIGFYALSLLSDDPLCRAGDELGAVECTGVPLAGLPHHLQDTRIFALTLAGNGLRKFPAGKLREMGE